MKHNTIYSDFHDWRSRLYQHMAEIATHNPDLMTALIGDMQQTVDRVQHSIDEQKEETVSADETVLQSICLSSDTALYTAQE
jgi:hypothetical protein